MYDKEETYMMVVVEYRYNMICNICIVFLNKDYINKHI